jgi:hypothetical protein
MTIRCVIGVVAVLFAVQEAAARCSDYDDLKKAYFGDLHVHTSYSLDSYGFDSRTDPASAYAFATGAAVDVTLDGPFGYTINFSGGKLDFATVTDHSEWLSTTYGCTVDTASPFYGEDYCDSLRNGGHPFNNPYPRPCASFPDQGTGCLDAQTDAWAAEKLATETANNPCTFTTFHAFEWTLNDAGAGLHKNVYFRNASVPDLPLDRFNYPTAPLLWAGLAEQCNPGNGCEALTIPHNMNDSKGRAFTVDLFSAIELNRMTEFQRLAEIHQHKGSSECVTDTADSGAVTACNFEVIPALTTSGDVPGYARSGLKQGLERFAAGGHDPLAFGFVGATDTHNGTPGAVGESGFVGHGGRVDNEASERLTFFLGPYPVFFPYYNPGGVTGVWAEENTRDALWAALRRRETFATSGPRMKVRFYALTDSSNPCVDFDPVRSLVIGGAVPMGGIFRSVPGSGAPRFVVYAERDEMNLKNLVAVDLVKGSVTAGVASEKVFTIPLAGQGPYCVNWTDPAFDAAAPAFYYARVREEPTDRWSVHDCDALGASAPSRCNPSDPMTVNYTIQERAWTSSIWYLPGAAVGVPATVLRARDGSATGDPTRRSFVFRAVTKPVLGAPRVVPPPQSGPGDPSIHGAQLTIQNPVETGETVTIPLPAGGWSATATRYTFSASAASPVRNVIVAPDRIVVTGGGSAWPFTLDEPRQGTLAVRLDLGTGASWCAAAPARATGAPPTTAPNDARDRFVGQRKAPPPDQCPVVGS